MTPAARRRRGPRLERVAMTQPTTMPAPPPPGDPAPVPTPPAPAPVPAPTATADPVDKPLGPTGESALATEREANRQLREKVAAFAAFDGIDPSALAALAKALGGKATGNTKTDLELLQQKFTEHEKTVAEERQARWRAEVANEKALTAQQAARLTGSTRDELLADADALLALFPAPPGPRTPVPDPSQGPRGGQALDLEAQIAEAQKAGDIRKVIALQRQKLQDVKR